MNMHFANEQEKLLHDIGILDFVVIELSLYLDTHSNDRNAMEYFNHYNRMSNQAKKEYSEKFGLTAVNGIGQHCLCLGKEAVLNVEL